MTHAELLTQNEYLVPVAHQSWAGSFRVHTGSYYYSQWHLDEVPYLIQLPMIKLVIYEIVLAPSTPY